MIERKKEALKIVLEHVSSGHVTSDEAVCIIEGIIDDVPQYVPYPTPIGPAEPLRPYYETYGTGGGTGYCPDKSGRVTITCDVDGKSMPPAEPIGTAAGKEGV